MTLRQLVADMTETMIAANGAGLAAIQVGCRLRLFIVDGHVPGGAEDPPPEGVHQPRDPGDLRRVADRATRAACRSPASSCRSSAACAPGCGPAISTATSSKVEGRALYARALQHETDHLNGRLLIDQVGPVKREIIKRKLRKDARGGKEERKRRRSARRPAEALGG